jgi:hypothetical protein
MRARFFWLGRRGGTCLLWDLLAVGFKLQTKSGCGTSLTPCQDAVAGRSEPRPYKILHDGTRPRLRGSADGGCRDGAQRAAPLQECDTTGTGSLGGWDLIIKGGAGRRTPGRRWIVGWGQRYYTADYEDAEAVG